MPSSISNSYRKSWITKTLNYLTIHKTYSPGSKSTHHDESLQFRRLPFWLKHEFLITLIRPLKINAKLLELRKSLYFVTRLCCKISLTPQVSSKLVHTKRYYFWFSLKAQKSMYHKWQFLIKIWLSESQKIW